MEKRRREEGERKRKSASTPTLFTEGPSTSATIASPQSETQELPALSPPPAKLRKREFKRLRLTVAEALARADRRKIILDPEEDSQLEITARKTDEEEGLRAPPPSPSSDSDIECTGMEGMQGSALASIYGR